jgi:hypothetical protein
MGNGNKQLPITDDDINDWHTSPLIFLLDLIGD